MSVDDTLILEGLVTTLDADGGVNVAPMGPRVDREIQSLTLRPFATSRTWHNLQRRGAGVFHTTDDVLLLARAAIGQLPPPPLAPVPSVQGMRLADCCRWFAFVVERADTSQPRLTLACRIVERGVVRPAFGYNRAQHAVLEASILATRIGILPDEAIQAELARLAAPVEKTAGLRERQAFDLLRQFVAERLGDRARPVAGGEA